MTLETIEDLSPRSDQNDDVQDLAFAKRGCCFCLPFSSGRGGGQSIFWERINPHHVGSNPDTPRTTVIGGGEDPWWRRGWKRLREWSEIVAGPKWKTLIRRFSNNNNNNKKKQKKRAKYHSQYDPLSYSLNFDDGQNGNFADDNDIFFRGFSSRFSLPPSSAKSSLDFDKEGISFA